MKFGRYFLLLLIFSLLLASRLCRISSLPSSVYWDEASIGYNAYSVGMDGKDEWGSFLPLHFRAFGEFKLPVYIYGVVPFVKMFGLNAFAVRFPSVLFTIGIVVLTYLIAKKVIRDESAALFSAFYIVVTPWLFIFSRSGYEATAGLMFYLLGVYLQFKSEDKIVWYYGSVACFIASVYSYNSFRIITPVTLFVLTVFILNKLEKKILGHFPVLLISLFVFLLSLIPIVRLYVYDTGFQRIQAVGLVGTPGEKLIQFSGNYLKNFSFNYLFIQGDTNLRSQQSGFGQLYWISLPLVLLGIFYVLEKRKLVYYSLLLGLMLSPIPAALTKENPHALRSVSSIFFYALLSGLGLKYLLLQFPKFKNVFSICVPFIFLIFFGFYLFSFFTDYGPHSRSDWQIEYKDIFESIQKNGVSGTQIVSDKYGQPYIFALFYLKYNPDKFRNTVKYNPPDRWGFSTVESFDGFVFKNE